MNNRNKTEKEEQLLIRWVNGHFISNKDTPISSLTEFDNGEKLLRFLLEIFSSTPAAQAIIPTLPPPSTGNSANSTGKGRVASTQKFQNLENFQRALSLATSVGVNFRFISAEDFIEHNIKMILSFITSSIVKFNALKLTVDPNGLRSPKMNAATPRNSNLKTKDFYDGILRGINKIIGKAPYSMHIEDFSIRNWANGLGFLALIHSCCPDEFDWEVYTSEAEKSLQENNVNLSFEEEENKFCLINLTAAFKYAQDLLDLFPLLVPEDFMPSASPALTYGSSDTSDDQGVMMYLSELYSIVLQKLPKDYFCIENEPPKLELNPEPVPSASSQAKKEIKKEHKKAEKKDNSVNTVSNDEYERVMKELAESKSKLNDLQTKLKTAESKQKEAEEAAAKAKEEAEAALKAQKEAEERAEKAAADADYSDDDDIVDDVRDDDDEYGRTRNAMTTTHTDEHKKVLKTSEQIKRAMERLEDLAEQAQEEDDDEALEALPEELEFLLDFISKKDKEVEDSAYLMNQLETQLSSSGDDTPLTNSEREEVDRIMKEINTEEKKVLEGIEEVIQDLLDGVVADKPVIAAELERIRSLAALGAERAGNAMKEGPPPAARIRAVAATTTAAAASSTSPKDKSNESKDKSNLTGPARSTSFVKTPAPPAAVNARPASVIIKPGKDSISVNSTAPVKRNESKDINSTMPSSSNSGSKKKGSENKKELNRSMTLPTIQKDDPFEDESKPVMPVIIEGLNDVEQKFEEDPDLKDKKGSISGAKNNANGFMEKTKEKFNKVVKIVKKANHKKEKKEKKNKEEKEKKEQEKKEKELKEKELKELKEKAANPDPKIIKEAVSPYRNAMIRATAIFEAAAGIIVEEGSGDEAKQQRVAELKKVGDKELVEAFENSAGAYEALLDVKNRALRDMQGALTNAQADVWEKLRAAEESDASQNDE